MGSKKNQIVEKMKEGDEIGKEGTDKGKEYVTDGREIKAILDSIVRTMDEDDVMVIDKTEGGYNRDFHSAFESDVQTKGEMTEAIETEVTNEASAEREKVDDAKSELSNVEGISDVGRNNATEGIQHMEQSSNEYEESIESANQILDRTLREINELQESLDSTFG
jgi:hypothetical protein